MRICTLLILLFFSLSTALSYGESRTDARPNVVFFLVDDLGVTDIGAYNPDSFYETPNVDRLAGEGMRFTQGYAACCVCSPTRFSLMTGKYPVRNACTDWFGAGRAERFRPATYHDRLDLEETTLGEAFVAANEPDKVRRMVFLGRCMLIPLILLGGWFGFLLASEMFGKSSGVVFLILWTFSPLFLGWGATLCPDMAAASLGVLSAYCFRKWIHAPTWKHAVIAGLVIGLLPLAKTTWIVAFGIFPLVWLLSKNRPAWKQGVVVMLLALYMLNMGYLFDGSFQLLKDYTFISESLRGETGNRFSKSVLGYVPVPFPAEFVQGIDTQKRDFEKGLESYLFGQYRQHGWWYYYFVVLALKEPLGTLLLFLAALLLTIRNKDYRGSWNDELLVAVPFLVLFAVLCSQTGFSIHPRYLLPAMPFFYLFASRIGRAFEFQGRPGKILVAGCLIWMAASSLWVYPYSISYFNELIPTRKRPDVLLGSCIDWGQDAYHLKRWLETHPEATPIRIEYPCPERIERLGIESAGRPPSEPESGWFALGVNDLYAAGEQYAWLKRIKPFAMVGYSIYIYHVSEPEAQRLQGGTDAP